MKHLSEVITAESLMKKPLDTQIVNAGGEGFNNTVLVERSSDSFRLVIRLWPVVCKNTHHT